jgi:hypothetical protein
VEDDAIIIHIITSAECKLLNSIIIIIIVGPARKKNLSRLI